MHLNFTGPTIQNIQIQPGFTLGPKRIPRGRSLQPPDWRQLPYRNSGNHQQVETTMAKPVSTATRNQIREEQNLMKNQIEALISDLKIKTTIFTPHPNSRPSICKETTKTPETGTTKTEPRKKFGIRTKFSVKPKREREEQRFSF
ncbi:hypothetical protein V8G54_029253 [Vigna mungo]|uniref:Uncharacterized protein n=1 Tax=Vigna mungo TaxID=3915 RepID=A0AAQ3MTW9_VIGMU